MRFYVLELKSPYYFLPWALVPNVWIRRAFVLVLFGLAVWGFHPLG